MKLKTVFLITASLSFLIFILTGYTVAKEKEPEPSPKAVIDQTTFTFSPVIAGTIVAHSFSIVNKGDASLSIPSVYTG